MEIKPIRTRSDYRKALKEIEALMNARAGTREGARLDVLATLVEAYERKRFPNGLPGPCGGDQVPHGAVWADP